MLDPRYHEGFRLLAASDFYEAADLFEELFFEAVREEVPFARAFLQIAVGLHHVQTRQQKPARQRLDEALKALDRIADAQGVDLAKLREDVRRIRDGGEARITVSWPAGPEG